PSASHRIRRKKTPPKRLLSETLTAALPTVQPWTRGDIAAGARAPPARTVVTSRVPSRPKRANGLSRAKFLDASRMDHDALCTVAGSARASEASRWSVAATSSRNEQQRRRSETCENGRGVFRFTRRA